MSWMRHILRRRAARQITFGSVCSGIEAASVAWEPLGWKAAWFAEIEAFPSAVLAHHWPDVPNLGDMTTIDASQVVAPDVLVGGTPCQAFSFAGLRGSLADPRGNLTLKFVELANAIDRQRDEPCIVVWENVPGVLNTKDNAFGCFLAGLAGEAVPLVPPGGRWANAGVVLGPERAVAWRVLDAQYFGLAQRRRRVFVVASARDGFDPAKVLFEFDGVRRDTPPSREAGQETAGNAVQRPTRAGSGRGVERAGETRGQDPVVAQQALYHDVSLCLNAGGMGRIDYESENMVVSVTGGVTHALNTANNGKGSSEDGTGRGVPTVAVPILKVGARTGKQHAVAAQTVALRGRNGGATAELGGEVATALRASTGGGDKPHVLATEVMPLNMQIVTRGGALGRSTGFGLGSETDPGFTLQAGHSHGVFDGSRLAVRRLTPTECERLQGFPDDHTAVPYRNKPATDGPRYRAIGNSMAVPVMRWIGERLI